MASSTSEFIVDLKQEQFQSEVIERSHTTPVLVDFWAPWCGPCRSLSPVLEKLAGEYAGAFLLAKINTDENPDLALAFQVRSIPQVVLFQEGQAVDQFAGAIPEAEIRRFLKPYCPTEVDQLFALARGKLDAGQKEEARGLLEQVVDREPQHSAARLALAKLLIEQQQPEQARSHLRAIPFLADEKEAADRMEQVIGFQADCEAAGGQASLRKPWKRIRKTWPFAWLWPPAWRRRDSIGKHWRNFWRWSPGTSTTGRTQPARPCWPYSA